jgi:hypothetical protein
MPTSIPTRRASRPVHIWGRSNLSQNVALRQVLGLPNSLGKLYPASLVTTNAGRTAMAESGWEALRSAMKLYARSMRSNMAVDTDVLAARWRVPMARRSLLR